MSAPPPVAAGPRPCTRPPARRARRWSPGGSCRHGASRRVGPVPRLVPTCVWKASPELLVTLDDRFGEPVDTYVNGSQVWLRDDGPAGEALEWRLHPVAGYRRPDGIAPEEGFDVVTAAPGAGGEPPGGPHRLRG